MRLASDAVAVNSAVKVSQFDSVSKFEVLKDCESQMMPATVPLPDDVDTISTFIRPL